MQSFDFHTPTKFILDKDADLLCGREVKRYSDKVLFVHYGDESPTSPVCMTGSWVP